MYLLYEWESFFGILRQPNWEGHVSGLLAHVTFHLYRLKGKVQTHISSLNLKIWFKKLYDLRPIHIIVLVLEEIVKIPVLNTKFLLCIANFLMLPKNIQIIKDWLGLMIFRWMLQKKIGKKVVFKCSHYRSTPVLSQYNWLMKVCKTVFRCKMPDCHSRKKWSWSISVPLD